MVRGGRVLPNGGLAQHQHSQHSQHLTFYQTPYFHSAFSCYQTLVWSVIFTQPIPSQFDKQYQTSSLINDFTPSFHVFLVKDNYELIWLIPTSLEQTLRNKCITVHFCAVCLEEGDWD